MAIHTINSEAEIVIFKAAGGTLEALDIVQHKKVAHYIMSALLLKHFPDLDFHTVNAGTSLYTRFGHHTTLVTNR